MKRLGAIWLVCLVSVNFAVAYEDEECCDEETPSCGQKRCRYRILPPEEEALWHDREEASWAGKRDDNFIDTFLHHQK